MSGPGGAGGTPGGGPPPRPEKKPPSERRPKDSEFFELPPDLKNLPQGPPRHAVGTRPADRHPPSSKALTPPVPEPLAMAAAVVGAIGAALAVLWIAAAVLPVTALGLGVVAKRRIGRSEGRRTGGGLALAGIVLGALGCVGGIVGWLARK